MIFCTVVQWQAEFQLILSHGAYETGETPVIYIVTGDWSNEFDVISVNLLNC